MRHEQRAQDGESLLESSLIKTAQRRLRFNSNDVHGSIEIWNNFFRLYNIESDYDKFFAVEQLLPLHIQKAMACSDDVVTSYSWLISYLKQRYDPKYLCYEMANRSVTKSTNINELRDMATEAANNPKEHLIKHFMMEPCSPYQRQQMRPFLLLSLKEFELKLKLIIREDGGRYSGQHANRSARVDLIAHDEFHMPQKALSEEGSKPSTLISREFKRSAPGNYKA